jgi:hypothetical protein
MRHGRPQRGDYRKCSLGELYFDFHAKFMNGHDPPSPFRATAGKLRVTLHLTYMIIITPALYELYVPML